MNFPVRIAFDEARAIIERVAADRCLGTEQAAIGRARGRVLARDLVAEIDHPGFDNSAMDGYALRHSDLAADKPLRLIGEQYAGRMLDLQIGPGECVRITTGAPIPQGADTVLIKESARLDGDRVYALSMPKPGQHVRRMGEDVRRGERLLATGQALTPARLALAAGQGMARVEIARLPTVAVFTTGDELVEPGLPLAPGELYDSNRELLMALLHADGLAPVAWPRLPDDPQAIASALRHAGHAFDVVITCGGVSAGEKDHLPMLMQAAGQVHFWKVRMKPGMPVLFAESHSALEGRAGSDAEQGLGQALFLCLPGNPVSVLATYLTLGRALLDGLQRRTSPRSRLRARLRAPWCKTHERLEFLRGRLACDDDGCLWVEPSPADGSHRMRAAADGDALIVLEEGERSLQAGEVVDVLAY
ncbi:MAG: molybdopterin molybdotransferase MoeA [Lysobacteraceae bacterium]|nr:MAG: molybdopterin molybdotransferase MoeA [Xanthomonadaceae bacterium]